MQRLSKAYQMTTPLRLQVPKYTASYGVQERSWEDVDAIIMANFSTYGGSERESNNMLVVEDTAEVVCWYRPDVKANCRVVLLDAGYTDGKPNAVYEVIGEPENIERRNQLLKFKVRRVRGGA